MRPFHTIYFDRGAGAGLLLLRVALGAVLALYALTGPVFDAPARSLSAILAGIELVACPCLLLGFISPIAALISCADFAVLIHTIRVGCGYSPMTANVVSVLALVIGGGLALVGPGAYSLDALLFGRREVIVDTLPGSRAE